MKVVIDEATCEKHGFTLQKVFLLLAIRSGEDDISEVLSTLIDDKMITNTEEGLLLYEGTSDKVDTIILDSEKAKKEIDREENLAIKLMNIFPKGKKEGTSQYFRGNKKEISLKLKKFLKLYGKYSDEVILDAAQKYVNSFNGRYTYMRVLKYFIIKDVRKVNEEGIGYIEEVSDLASYIENEDSDQVLNDWTANLT